MFDGEGFFAFIVAAFRFVIGCSSGMLIAAALFALITTLGIINRMAQCTHSARRIRLYEECVIWGASLGNILWIYNIGIPFKMPFYIVFGLVGGIYTGCLAVALAEVIKTIPVFAMRLKLKSNLGFIILMLALGKGIGGIVYFFNYL